MTELHEGWADGAFQWVECGFLLCPAACQAVRGMSGLSFLRRVGAYRSFFVGLRLVAGGVLLVALVACGPALNWRSVALGEIGVTLPCKPDRAQRAVNLAELSLDMEMVGCEADGALFAVSRVRMPQGTTSTALQAQWQTASLQQMRGRIDPAPQPILAGPKNLPLRIVSAQGQGNDGRQVQALLAWVTVGGDLVHFAVYAPRLSTELTEPFFDGIRAP